MEAANESARHAGNAILKADRFVGDLCKTVDPERHEFQDLRWLAELNYRLWAAGLPHLVDVLGSEAVLDALTDPAMIIAPHDDGGGRRARLAVFALRSTNSRGNVHAGRPPEE